MSTVSRKGKFFLESAEFSLHFVETFGAIFFTLPHPFMKKSSSTFSKLVVWKYNKNWVNCFVNDNVALYQLRVSNFFFFTAFFAKLTAYWVRGGGGQYLNQRPLFFMHVHFLNGTLLHWSKVFIETHFIKSNEVKAMIKQK